MEQYDYPEAVKQFQRAVDLAPESVAARVNLAIALFNRAGKGDMELAEKALDEVIRGKRDDGQALYFRGVIHQYRGQDEKAIPYFERVLKVLPHDAYTWYLLGRSKGHLGQACRTELERAIQENPNLASAHYDLIRIAMKAGDKQAARAHQQTFVKLRQNPLAEMVAIPHYRRMGPLGLVRPISGRSERPAAASELVTEEAKIIFLGSGSVAIRDFNAQEQRTMADKRLWGLGVQLALADVNHDGHVDMVTTAVVRNGQRGVLLLLGEPDGSFRDASGPSGLMSVARAISCAFGDYDNDGHVDLFVNCGGRNHLFRGRGDGTFDDVTEETNTGGSDVVSLSAVFLDADHDADLDIYVCNRMAGDGGLSAANQLLNNNADGTFTDIAAEAGVASAAERSVMLAPADIDSDRDTDLIVFNEGGSMRVFFNDRVGKYHEGQISSEPLRGDNGGVLQDFNGDGRVDLLISPGPSAPGQLYLTDAVGRFQPSGQFTGCMETVTTWGAPRTTRVADVDLDGDLDVVVFGRDGHVLLNDGWGRFVVKPKVWPAPPDDAVIASELADLTGDGVVDLVRLSSSGNGRIELVPTTLAPPTNWLAVTPTGDRGADGRTRSPASGFGTRIELRCGRHSQTITYTGLNGGLSQSRTPLVFGLNGAVKADYAVLVWPDGVSQAENDLAAAAHHRISEMERRVSSCPVLFAWNGKRFAFIGDFAGVGGLGYFVAPGQYAPPQSVDRVRIESDQLVSKGDHYELRICEPMEEVAFIDRVELLAVDHAHDSCVYPDERLALTGPLPSGKLLCVDERVFPLSAVAPDGTDCTEQLVEVDRVYAYQPPLDQRFIGFCQPHTLVLDFADRLGVLAPGRRVYLFLTGSIEYPYSQTTFAARQAGVVWQPLKIEQQTSDGRWQIVVDDAGAPGGIGRTVAIDLTGKLVADGVRLRISTNLEIYYDQIFMAADLGTDALTIRTVPLVRADLRRLGFPLEYSPDGQHPTIYTYDIIEPTCSFKMPKGAYTPYGPVDGLLRAYDDRYAIFGTGDEIAVRFNGRGLPALAEGQDRTFILVSHAHCKDMDLYTAESDTVGPLPLRKMLEYPYSFDESDPDTAKLASWHRRFNTRQVP